MLTHFDDGHDFQKPVTFFTEALKKVSEVDLLTKLGEVAVISASDDTMPYYSQGAQLRLQYEGMNDEQRRGFDAALIALTGFSYQSLVEYAIEETLEMTWFDDDE